jgi:positive regulator of sigma E activity
MKQREPTNETDVLRCPDALDCAECAAAVECLSDIISALSQEQRKQILQALRGDNPS